MLNNCPVLLNPLDYAKRGAEIKGQIAVADFKRLVALVVDGNIQNSIDVDLQFDVDAAHDHRLTGSIKGSLVLDCQRCLHDMDFEVEILLNHVLCANDDCLDKHKEKDTLSCDEDKKMRLADLLEDELLLALPFAPKHKDVSDCQGLEAYIDSNDANEEIVEKVPSPFSGLKDQLNLG